MQVRIMNERQLPFNLFNHDTITTTTEVEKKKTLFFFVLLLCVFSLGTFVSCIKTDYPING